MLRGAITGGGTFAGGIFHTLPFLIPGYSAAIIAAITVVATELLTLAWLRHKFFQTSFARSFLAVTVGGAIIASPERRPGHPRGGPTLDRRRGRRLRPPDWLPDLDEQREGCSGPGSVGEMGAQVRGQGLRVVLPDRLVEPSFRQDEVTGDPDRQRRTASRTGRAACVADPARTP